MTVPMVRGDESAMRSPQVRGWDPLSQFNQLTEQLTRMFNEDAGAPMRARDGFTPAVDVEETEDAFLVELELPGVKKGDIDINITDGRLVVSGERKETERTGFLRKRGRSYGRFVYQIGFADEVDEDNIEATMEDGVLRLRVPKRTSSQSRHIDVK